MDGAKFLSPVLDHAETFLQPCIEPHLGQERNGAGEGGRVWGGGGGVGVVAERIGTPHGTAK